MTEQVSQTYIVTRKSYEHKNSFKREKRMKIYFNEQMVHRNGLYNAHYNPKGQQDCKQRCFWKKQFYFKVYLLAARKPY
jgi:hypothetical protein